jgi:iron-sulfur cluster assembly protein
MSTAQRPETTVDLKVTDKAIEQVRIFIGQSEAPAETAGLRVAVMPGGCAGFRYALNIEDGPQDDDIVIERDGLSIFVDVFSGQYLSGAELDYVETMQASGFKFTNPNASGGCGCGDSFSA